MTAYHTGAESDKLDDVRHRSRAGSRGTRAVRITAASAAPLQVLRAGRAQRAGPRAARCARARLGARPSLGGRFGFFRNDAEAAIAALKKGSSGSEPMQGGALQYTKRLASGPLRCPVCPPMFPRSISKGKAFDLSRSAGCRLPRESPL